MPLCISNNNNINTTNDNTVVSSFSLSKTDKKINENTQKIPSIDVSGKTFSSLFLKRLERCLSFLKLLEGLFNSHTIITGASTYWDCERLKSGKHKLFQEIGAEHIQLKSKTGCMVDTHYFSASTIINRLEELGGNRSLFQFEINNMELFTGKKCLCEISSDCLVELQEIHLSSHQQQKDKYGDFEIEDYLSKMADLKLHVIQDEKSGKFYVADSRALGELQIANLLKKNKVLANANIKETSFSRSLLKDNEKFPGIKFDKKSSQWKEAVKILEEMKIDKSLWNIVETEQAIYVAASKHCDKIRLAAENKNISLHEHTTKAPVDSSTRGVVLLTTNQSDVYEAYPHEILTFALEGVDVMGYNTPGKGMSTGLSDLENVNASIEACYQYLKMKNIPDGKILAKGQCFGGAPTAWLGKMHPHINLMLDQNPANFHDVVMQRLNSAADSMMEKDRCNFTRWIGKILKDNLIINGIARAVLGGWDIPGDLAHNRGNKLFNINVPNERGAGGDQLVPQHHPILMLDSLHDTNGKKLTLSMNPGASHITDWWAGQASQDTVIRFLKEIGISQPLFIDPAAIVL